MINFKKVFNLRLVSVFIALSFLLQSSAYGINLSQKAHLRVPLDSVRLEAALEGAAEENSARTIEELEVIANDETRSLDARRAALWDLKIIEKTGSDDEAVAAYETLKRVHRRNRTRPVSTGIANTAFDYKKAAERVGVKPAKKLPKVLRDNFDEDVLRLAVERILSIAEKDKELAESGTLQPGEFVAGRLGLTKHIERGLRVRNEILGNRDVFEKTGLSWILDMQSKLPTSLLNRQRLVDFLVSVCEERERELVVVERVFEKKGYLNVNALRELVAIAADNSGLNPADMQPVVIGSAVYMSDEDGYVDTRLIGDVDIVWETSLSDRQFSYAYRHKLAKELKNLFGNMTKDLAIDENGPYGPSITLPIVGSDAESVLISITGIASPDIVGDTLEEIETVVDLRFERMKHEAERYGYDKIIKKYLMVMFYLKDCPEIEITFGEFRDRYAAMARNNEEQKAEKLLEELFGKITNIKRKTPHFITINRTTILAAIDASLFPKARADEGTRLASNEKAGPEPDFAAPEEGEPFGSFIERLREARGMSRRVLARLVGCNTSYIYYIETGRSFPGDEILIRLSEVLVFERHTFAGKRSYPGRPGIRKPVVLARFSTEVQKMAAQRILQTAKGEEGHLVQLMSQAVVFGRQGKPWKTLRAGGVQTGRVANAANIIREEILRDTESFLKTGLQFILDLQEDSLKERISYENLVAFLIYVCEQCEGELAAGGTTLASGENIVSDILSREGLYLLDIGTQEGNFLRALAQRNPLSEKLVGIDPSVPESTFFENGVNIELRRLSTKDPGWKKRIEQENYDVVTIVYPDKLARDEIDSLLIVAAWAVKPKGAIMVVCDSSGLAEEVEKRMLSEYTIMLIRAISGNYIEFTDVKSLPLPDNWPRTTHTATGSSREEHRLVIGIKKSRVLPIELERSPSIDSSL